MQYQYTSLKSVIGDVIRNTRIQDASFIADIHEWLYQAMDMLETELTLEGKCETITVNYHKAKLPCGLRYIDAVQYNGHRLREGGGVRPAAHDTKLIYQDATAWVSDVEKQNFEGHELYVSQIYGVSQMSALQDDYYYTDMGYFNSSFQDGTCMLYYRGVKVDEDGFPMIPDNQAYKMALYFFSRAMMIGAGWKDPVFSYEKCMENFELLYGPRAMAEIRLPSPEQMEQRINTFVRFIPHQGFYDNFFSTPTREGMYDTRTWGPGNGENSANVVAPQQPYIVGTKPLE